MRRHAEVDGLNPKTGIGFTGENRASREQTTCSTKWPEEEIPVLPLGSPSASVASVSFREWSSAFGLKAPIVKLATDLAMRSGVGTRDLCVRHDGKKALALSALPSLSRQNTASKKSFPAEN
jgi:hypothetical protein